MFRKDKRINTRAITFWETVGIFLAMISFSGFHMWIYSALQEVWPHSSGSPGNAIPYILTMGGYVLFVATAMTLFTMVMRRYSLGRPMQRISEAARQVAQGDFSVRIKPLRTDEKKDYIEVMFDDFNKMTEELASIESLKDDFISNVSHEIKTPLSVIQNYTAALDNDALTPEERKEYHATIVSATQKLSDLVTNILKLNRLDNQEIGVKTAPFSLDEQLRQCVLQFESQWEEKGILFQAEIEDNIWVCFDASMLEIVWNNLMSNAIKFTAPGGAITVGLKGEAGSAVVFITDSGCGMNSETQKHIFEKFYQGETTQSKDGNGLGLALVKRVIDLSGGSIWVKSKAGEGTSFFVRLAMQSEAV